MSLFEQVHDCTESRKIASRKINRKRVYPRNDWSKYLFVEKCLTRQIVKLIPAGGTDQWRVKIALVVCSHYRGALFNDVLLAIGAILKTDPGDRATQCIA